MRAVTPMPATTVAQTSETTTILRWVLRSAVSMDVLFMALSWGFPPVLFAHWSPQAAKGFISVYGLEARKAARSSPGPRNRLKTPLLPGGSMVLLTNG